MNSASSTSPIPNQSPFHMKHSHPTPSILKPIAFLLASLAIAQGADSDFDGLDDAVESNTGVYVSPTNTGTNPGAADSDGDGARDGWEVDNGSNPLLTSSFPRPTSPKVSIRPFSNILDSEISPLKQYTHAVSGGSPAVVNGVTFDELSANATPSNFNWNAGNTKNQIRATDANPFNDWIPLNGNITNPEIINLLSGFTYATQAWYTPTQPQRYTLTNLTKGNFYELRIYIRVWDKGGNGAPVDITFTNGLEVIQPWGGLPANRPDYVTGTQNRDSAYFISYIYQAQTTDLFIDASVHPSMPWNNGSFHLHALTNEVAKDSDGDMLPDLFETNSGTFITPTNTGTNPNNSDSDSDGISDGSEVYTYSTNPNHADTDGDGLSDGYELGIGRFSIVTGSFTWQQAREDAWSKGGDLASFPTEDRWNRAMQNLAANPFEDFTGLWIGANNAAVDGTWTWVNGEAFSFAPWGTGRPSSTSVSAQPAGSSRPAA
jgi:hypothetical protein